MKIIYTAIQLTDSRKDILDFAKLTFGELYNKVYCDHITLNFYNKTNLYKDGEFNIGEVVKFNIIGFVLDDNAQVFVCETNQKCMNKFPHITISTKENIEPKYSNFLLDGKEYTKIKPIESNGIIRNKIY